MTLSFKEMMGILPTGIHPSKDGDVFDIYDEDMIEFLEHEYKKNIALLENSAPARIPKVIHFIWIGPKPFPEESIENVLSWQKYHPSWELIFWTDSEERPLPVEKMTRKLIQEHHFGPMQSFIDLSQNWGEKSDLLRYHIIEEFGGFYTDHDSRCLRSFEPFLQFDAVVCCEEPAWRGGVGASHVLFQNGLFGAKPHHAFLKRTQENVARIWHELDAAYPDGNDPTPSWKVLRRTFDAFTLAVKDVLKQKAYRETMHDLLLPTCYFFPNRILSEEDILRFIEKGVIWSSHEYAGLWADGAWGDIYN